MFTSTASLRPSPFESPLLGFLERLGPGARYAIHPLGRYSRACVEDAPAGCLEADGRRLLGFIDDGATAGAYFDRPVAPLRDAAHWPIDALLLLRDTHDRTMRRSIAIMQDEGLLRGVRIIDQPSPTLDAMLAHQDTYEPGCEYSKEFVTACRTACHPERSEGPGVFCKTGAAARTDQILRFAQNDSASSVLLTLDAEQFPCADRDADWLYPTVMREFTRIMHDFGFSFTLCVQFHDTPGGMRRTPPTVVEDVVHALGPRCVALHGLDHSMPSDGYAAEWFERGLGELRSRFGVETAYWAPPGWTLNWRTLRVLHDSAIRAVRGIRTGVNVRRGETIETFRFPYRVGDLWQIPYAYADWMFADVDGNRLDSTAILPWHEQLAEFASRAPCVIESVAHPFRLVGRDWRERLRIVRKTLECYARRGVTLLSVADGLNRPAAVAGSHAERAERSEESGRDGKRAQVCQ